MWNNTLNVKLLCKEVASDKEDVDSVVMDINGQFVDYFNSLSELQPTLTKKGQNWSTIFVCITISISNTAISNYGSPVEANSLIVDFFVLFNQILW